jgi:hypothetical protein
MSGQLHVPAALSPGKQPPVPIVQEAVHPVASRYTDCTIPAPLGSGGG